MHTSERKNLIDKAIRELRSSLPVRAPVDDGVLQSYYRKGDYTSMVRFVRNSMRLTLRVRVGLVRSGGKSAPAWVSFLEPMPLFGSKEFEAEAATIFLRKDFLQDADFEPTVVAISHEMAHLVLESIRHPLRHLEEAVDITAMMLGYRDFFVTGTTYKTRQEVARSPLEAYLQAEHNRDAWQLGYLSRDEMRHVAHAIAT